MKSDIIHVTSNGIGIQDALLQTEACARFCNLSHKQALHLRLLTEEMMGMLQALTGEAKADFWIEYENGAFRLHLLAYCDMNYKKRRKLLEVSTTGTNAAAKGVTGKLRDLMERAFEPYDSDIPTYYNSGFVPYDSYSGNVGVAAAAIWSFNRYRSVLEENGTDTEEWDELEKSIVANIADEIEMGIKSDTVEMTIIKKF